MYTIRKITRHEYIWITSSIIHKLFSQLTESVLLSQTKFQKWFTEVQSNPCFTLFGIIESETEYSKPTLVGLGTLWIQPKYYHNNRRSGHIEDIIIDKKHRQKGLGKKLIEYIIETAINADCYKIQLHCTEEMQKFYERLTFKNRLRSMEIKIV